MSNQTPPDGNESAPAKNYREPKKETVDDLFDQELTFRDLGLSDDVLAALDDAGFEKPTLIQAKLIPRVLEGKDVMGQARTGTGKTAAFGLPMLSMADPDVKMQGLVLTPTRELAAQVAAEIDELGKHTQIRTTCVIGGESMRQQQNSIERGGHIIVGTPGRVMDLHGRRQLSFENIRWAVLDEVDRMLDIGFRDDIRKILKTMSGEQQTIFVSATIDPPIESLARQFMKKDAEKIVTVAGSLTVSLVDQTYISVEPWDKKQMLLHLLRTKEPDTTVVFCRTKATVHRLATYLKDKGVNAREIHGDLHQSKRNSVIESMREGNVQVLIASDVAARGLDIEHITHVVNYDVPEDPEVYVHRIGRTARAGRRGVAWTFITPEEGQRLTEIEKLTGVLIEQSDITDFKPGPLPKDVQQERERASQRADPHKALQAREDAVGNPDEMSDEEIKKRFPSGVVPKAKPGRGLGGKFRTRRR